MSRKSIKSIHTKDRISNLPEAIILKILSFMDAKTAVRTGFLSKQFAYLWTEAPCLNFEEATMEFIYTTILFHKRHKLEKVSVAIRYQYEWDLEFEFCRFIRLLSSSSVKEFVLKLVGEICYALPKLTLTNCDMLLQGFVNWKSLQSLSLDSMELSDKTINDVLSGCPSLEFLKLSKIYFSSRFSDSSGIWRCYLTNNKCLRKLVIDHYCGRGTLEIVAPNLQFLDISGGVRWSEFKVLNAKCLTDCFLDFYGDTYEVDGKKMLTSLLDDLSHVEVVTIGEWILQVLFLIQPHMWPFPMSKAIKCLRIRTRLTDNMAGIEWLLRNLNHLETLSIELSDYDDEDLLLEFMEKIGTAKKMQTKVDSKLKNVKVCYLVADEQFKYHMTEFSY